MAISHDLELVIENLQDMAASRELSRMADHLADDYPEAARLLHNRASHLQAVTEQRRQRTAEIRQKAADTRPAIA